MITGVDQAARINELTDRIALLEAGLRRIKAGIEKYATDTVWIGELETACDAIELLLGPTAETAVNLCKHKGCKLSAGYGGEYCDEHL